MKKPFTWDDRAKRYRDERGRFISAKKILAARDDFTAYRHGAMDRLTSSLVSGEITIQQWTLNMRDEIKSTYMAEYMLGVGGKNKMTQADYGRVGGMLRRQYAYLQTFAEEIRAGKLTPAQIAARSKLYTNGATQAFERAKAADMGLPDLPAYPGDGQTVCRSNCHCNWAIVDTPTTWECYWQLNPAEHCDDCIENNVAWNPLIIPKR